MHSKAGRDSGAQHSPGCLQHPQGVTKLSVLIISNRFSKTATSANMEISVRSGGHSYTCTNLKEIIQEILGL